ncbi:hypothetical protein [Collimonas silvisoli]|uniref:hypothetical protein n=1 Tax=Collimonas silvisoli TaxID=2825884 RepID=UPI001B8D299E|nr:hypothetical protein [Collimonas silvisoli]
MSAQAFRPRRLQHAASAPVLALVLICTILFAQWLGLTHSIVHAAWENKQPTRLTHMTSVIERVIEGGRKAHHSCAAFDDATLAAAIYSAPVTLPPVPGKHLLALWQAFASWDAPFTCHFSPRAPPRS